jgi:hypothetical protein
MKIEDANGEEFVEFLPPVRRPLPFDPMGD